MEEHQKAEVQAKVQAEEERRRAQMEATKQKVQAELEARQRAGEASGLGLTPKGVLRSVGALEKGKGVQRATCDCCMGQGIVCEVSFVSWVQIYF